MPATAERSIRIAVARDGIRAHLITSDVKPASITRQAIVAALQEQGIGVDEQLLNRATEIEGSARAGQLGTEPILLVEGREPVEGTPATFELAGELAGGPDDAEDDRTDFYRSQILTVEPEAAIGMLTPEVPAADGIDVHGKPVPAPPLARSFELGPNVRLDEDGSTVRATVAGKLHLTRHQVNVVPVVEIDGDVDFGSGNVDSPTDVLVNGTVRETFEVRSSASITIRGSIEGATVEAGTDIQVNGGIASRNLGKIVAGGEIFTKFCKDTCLEATGDITVTREAMNSSIRTQGKLVIARGKLIGGTAYARLGAEIAEIGNETSVKSEIAVGIDPLDLIEIAKTDEIVKKKLDAIAKIRQNVQPLMAQLKRLTPAQRERATELLYQADTMEQEIAEHQQRKAQALGQNAPDGREVLIVVQKVAWPGTRLVFGNKVATLHNERKGPFKVVRRVHKRVEEILLIDKVSNSITVLGSREYEP